MEKLPPTSYVRLVDIWLINGQLVPFLEVILLTVLELNRDETSAINHHGFKRLTKITYNVKEGATAVFLLLDCLQNCYYRPSLSDFELGPTEQGAETM